jgi:hypothetical protein
MVTVTECPYRPSAGDGAFFGFLYSSDAAFSVNAHGDKPTMPHTPITIGTERDIWFSQLVRESVS